MNSEITVHDIKVMINNQIDEYIKDLFDEVYNFDKVININDLNDWYDDIENNIKILKNLKLLENNIDSQDIFTDDEINSYYTLACKPERINIKKKRIKNFNPYTGKFIYDNVEYVK